MGFFFPCNAILALKIQTFFVEYQIAANFPSPLGWVDNDWISMCGWTVPWSQGWLKGTAWLWSLINKKSLTHPLMVQIICFENSSSHHQDSLKCPTEWTTGMITEISKRLPTVQSCCFAGASGHRRERFALWWVWREPTAQRTQRALVHAPESHRRGAGPSPRWQRHLWPNADHGLPGAEFQQWWDWMKTLCHPQVFWSTVAGLDWSRTSFIHSWVSYFAFSFQHLFVDYYLVCPCFFFHHLFNRFFLHFSFSLGLHSSIIALI